eukprot:3880847-Alexandrium_andersonii.AAC.1
MQAATQGAGVLAPWQAGSEGDAPAPPTETQEFAGSPEGIAAAYEAWGGWLRTVVGQLRAVVQAH